MFHLFCDPLNSAFHLHQDGEVWQKTFDSFEAAYEHAEARVTGEAGLVLHGMNGSVIYETTLCSLEPELRKARAHWRELARGAESEAVLPGGGNR